MTAGISDRELAALPGKAKRDAEVVRLYREHDYLAAYAAHTDLRVLREGYQPAAGADASRNNWDSHGNLQRDFLLCRGLQPHHRLLEVGCGSGRLARKVVPYLEEWRYSGIDISVEAIAVAMSLSVIEGWHVKRPKLYAAEVASLPPMSPFDFVWAHSVFTHLPVPMIEDVMREVVRRLAPGGAFYWTYLPGDVTERYGLTQFRTSEADMRACAERAGLSFEPVPDWVRVAGHEPGRWSGEQLVAVGRALC